MYSVEREWDRLDACVVGRSYPASYYDWIPNQQVRETMQQMATATCNGLDTLADILHSHSVTVLRPNIPAQADPEHFPVPPQQPRDYMFMAGKDFCYRDTYWQKFYRNVKSPHWLDYDNLDQFLALASNAEIQELTGRCDLDQEIRYIRRFDSAYSDIVHHVRQQGNVTKNLDWADGGMIMRLGQQWIWGTNPDEVPDHTRYRQQWRNRIHHVVRSAGHIDAIFCVPRPGLLIAVNDHDCHIDYESIVPGWRIHRLPGSNLMRDLARSRDMQQFVEQTKGRWWLPGAEHDSALTNYIEDKFANWFGHSWESAFDVNMLVIDDRNVLTTSTDSQFLDILADNDITPHVVAEHFTTMYFWDGGLHCMTADLNRISSE
jgi:hypothetical protein